jgi:hypothetical protein
MAAQFAINDDPAAQDVAFLEDQIIAFNFATTSFHHGKMLSVFVRD